jgi:hypothetical protein
MSEEELKKLIGKYYNGISTEDDENALRAYFSENNAPPGYEAEKAMFSFFMEAGEVPEPSADFEAGIIKSIDPSLGNGRSAQVRRLLVPVLSAAAGLLILAGSYFFFVHRIEPKDTYADPRIAYAETIKILLDVSSRINHGTRSLKPVGMINEMKIKSFESINKSAVLVERNLKTLGYLRNSPEIDSASKEKMNN